MGGERDNSYHICFEAAHGDCQPNAAARITYVFFKRGGPHAPSPSHKLLPRLTSTSAALFSRHRDSAGSARRGEAQAGEDFFFSVPLRNPPRWEGSPPRPVYSPRPGLAQEPPATGLTRTQGCAVLCPPCRFPGYLTRLPSLINYAQTHRSRVVEAPGARSAAAR